jgi:hypothetical protein
MDILASHKDVLVYAKEGKIIILQRYKNRPNQMIVISAKEVNKIIKALLEAKKKLQEKQENADKSGENVK